MDAVDPSSFGSRACAFGRISRLTRKISELDRRRVIDTRNPRISLFRWASFRDWSIARQSECRITWIIYVALSAGSSSFELSDHIAFEPIHPLPPERATSLPACLSLAISFRSFPLPRESTTYRCARVYTRWTSLIRDPKTFPSTI